MKGCRIWNGQCVNCNTTSINETTHAPHYWKTYKCKLCGEEFAVERIAFMEEANELD